MRKELPRKRCEMNNRAIVWAHTTSTPFKTVSRCHHKCLVYLVKLPKKKEDVKQKRIQWKGLKEGENMLFRKKDRLVSVTRSLSRNELKLYISLNFELYNFSSNLFPARGFPCFHLPGMNTYNNQGWKHVFLPLKTTAGTSQLFFNPFPEILRNSPKKSWRDKIWGFCGSFIIHTFLSLLKNVSNAPKKPRILFNSAQLSITCTPGITIILWLCLLLCTPFSSCLLWHYISLLYAAYHKK